MVRTINRQPYTVKQLDYGDVKYKFFNHSNWKGVCDDKNYLGVDQETFADSKNVYVDSEGILKSRPSVKQYVMTQSGLQEIYDLWTFGQWTVYEVRSNNAPALIFRKGDVFSNSPIPVNPDFRLILADEKIFVFEPNNLWYVDLTAETISKIDGKDKIYVPVTETVAEGKHITNESPNVLTTSYITRYLYQKGESILEIQGKTGTVKIGDDTYTITFTPGTMLTLVKKCIKLQTNNYKNSVPLVFVNSNTNIILLAQYDDIAKYSLSYSIDGFVYKELPYLDGQVDILPCISQSADHVYAVLHRNDGPYAYTILAGEDKTDAEKFSVWTNLLGTTQSYKGSYSFATSVPSSLSPTQFYPTTSADNDKFVYDYGSGRKPMLGDTIYYDIQDNTLSFNSSKRYKFVCVLVYIIDADTTHYYWKGYNINDTATQWNYVDGVLKDLETPIAETLIGNSTPNTSYLSQEELKAVIPNPNDGDTVKYVKVENSAVSGASYSSYTYRYLKNKSKWMVSPYNIYYYYSGISFDKIREYYFDETLYSFQMKTKSQVAAKNLASFSNLEANRLLVMNNDKLTDIRLGSILGKCFCNKDIVCLASTLYNVLSYRISDGTSISGIFEHSDLYEYNLDSISVFAATNYLQICRIVTDNKVSGNIYNRKIKIERVQYLEGTVNDTTNLSFYYTSNETPVSGTCEAELVQAFGEQWHKEVSGFNISSYYTNVLTNKSYIQGDAENPLLFEANPIAVTKDSFFVIKDNLLYTSNFNSAEIDITTQGELKFDVFDHETELSQFFVSKGKNLYINAQGSNVGVDDFKWYFPERNVQEFDYEITNLHPISTTEIAVFLQDSIYYVKPVTTTIDGIETIAYSYYKSRIPLGCEQGSDVITSYDNKYTMFATKRGFVAMSYQDFIASDEQALTFLSDTIYDMFNEWNKGAIKLFQYNFWIILYRTNTGKAFIFDMRSNSWWPIEYNSNVKKFIEIDRKPLLLSGLYLYKLDTSNDNYFDGNSLKDGRIDWHLSSQKLHLDAINYYKHIVNLTFFGYNYGDKDVNVRFNLRVVNYRKQTDTNETKSFSAVDYKIQLTRTFVTRINYYKVNQVQYILESSRDEDAEDKIPVPLSLTAISLKYLVTGQVR